MRGSIIGKTKHRGSCVRALSLLLALLFLFSLPGCGRGKATEAADTALLRTVRDAEPEEPDPQEANVSAVLPDKNAPAPKTEDRDEEEERERAAAEEERRQAEEDRRKAEEEERRQAEEEERRQAEEEERRQAEEEERRRAEEEERRRAEEEEERRRAEEEAIQRNSFSMMYYLALTAEEIRSSRDNRLILNDIYASLLNDIDPSAVDEETQQHLKELRDTIFHFLNISAKRDRIQFIYNQEKASAIREAVPDLAGLLEDDDSIHLRDLDWGRLAVITVLTVIDSYNRYKTASSSADMNYLMSGWDLDDAEVEEIRNNQGQVFDYMVDMVQKYHLDGKLTLNQNAIEKFNEICSGKPVPEKMKWLESEESTYQLLGNYWLELADCYYETGQYEKCLASVARYNALSIGIYRQDFNYARILPKAVVAAQKTRTGEQYISIAAEFADAIDRNTSKDDWAARYFLAQVCLDLYDRTQDKKYLKAAYENVFNNVNRLLGVQRELNDTYLADVRELDADYRFMSETEKKEEEKRLKAYNKALKTARKTELPTLYEPLILNCELLFALADKLQLDAGKRAEIEEVLQTASGGTFLTSPINDLYSFSRRGTRYFTEFGKDKLVLPVCLLTAGSTVTITICENGSCVTLDDLTLSKVVRKGSAAGSFLAHYSSKQLKKHKWRADSEIMVTITYGDAYDHAIVLHYFVDTFEPHWYGDKVTFRQT